MISPLKKLFEKRPTRPLDLATIRTSGVNISALASSHLRVMEELNKEYQTLADELLHTDPCSEEGKEFEQLFLALNRVYLSVSGVHKFIAIGEALKEFRRESPATPCLNAMLGVHTEKTEAMKKYVQEHKHAAVC